MGLPSCSLACSEASGPSVGMKLLNCTRARALRMGPISGMTEGAPPPLRLFCTVSLSVG